MVSQSGAAGAAASCLASFEVRFAVSSCLFLWWVE